MFYQSTQFIKVRHTKLALVSFFIKLLVFFYLVGFTIIWDKGYQEIDLPVTDILTKVKGSASTMDANGNVEVFDEYDLVIPPLIPDASFTGIGYILTANQTKSTCSGNDPNTELCACANFNTVEECCQAGTYTENGMKTGQCNETTGFCELQTWCPLENSKESKWLQGVENFTLFARVDIRFPKFNYSLSNTDGYDAISTPNGVNLFSLKQIAANAGYDEFDSLVASRGGVFLVNYIYDCDIGSKHPCKPNIEFTRLDDPTSSLSGGLTYRYQKTTRDLHSGYLTRDLWKLYGFYVIFEAHGQAGRFDWVTILITLGAGLGYFSISTVICDIILLKILKHKQEYESRKFEVVHSTGYEKHGFDINEEASASLL